MYELIENSANEQFNLSQNLFSSKIGDLLEASRYNFRLDSKLVRPQALLAYGLMIEEASNGLTEEFFESERYQNLLKWVCVCETIHNSSLVHVSNFVCSYFSFFLRYIFEVHIFVLF